MTMMLLHTTIMQLVAFPVRIIRQRATQALRSDTSRCFVSIRSHSDSIQANVTMTKPYYRIYYNDVYEVHLPPKHRFPMKKYAQVRTLLQKLISSLPIEEQEKVHCGRSVFVDEKALHWITLLRTLNRHSLMS